MHLAWSVYSVFSLSVELSLCRTFARRCAFGETRCLRLFLSWLRQTIQIVSECNSRLSSLQLGAPSLARNANFGQVINEVRIYTRRLNKQGRFYYNLRQFAIKCFTGVV